MDAKDAVTQHDLIHFSDDQLGTVSQHGAANLCAEIACSITTLLSYSPRCRIAASSSSALSTLVTPNDEPDRAGFTNTGYSQLVRRRHVGAVQHPELRSGDSRASRDDVRERLVHADRRALDVAAHVGDPDSSSSPCTAPSSPVLPCRTGNTASMCTARHSPPSTTSSPCVSRSGEITARRHCRPPIRRRSLAHLPDACLGDADVDRLVLLRVDARGDLHRRLHRHVMFLRAAPEQDRDLDRFVIFAGSLRSLRQFMSVCSTVSYNARPV